MCNPGGRDLCVCMCMYVAVSPRVERGVGDLGELEGEVSGSRKAASVLFFR